jgi:uncharacterized protein, YfiH family
MKLIPWNISSDITAFTTTRINGYSKDSYDSLNLALNVNDNNDTVIKNRIKLAKYLNTDLEHMISPHQTHSTSFLEVSLKDGGKGMYSLDNAFQNCDGLYTKDKNLYLMTYHADCIPILIYVKNKNIIGALHSGWKGTVNEILNKFLKHLINNEEVTSDEIYGYIGPSLSQKNFEAKDDIINLVKKMSFNTSCYYTVKEEGSYLLDGKGLCLEQFLINGVKRENIFISTYCTIENNDLFYSYRVDKNCGRNATIIMRK